MDDAAGLGAGRDARGHAGRHAAARRRDRATGAPGHRRRARFAAVPRRRRRHVHRPQRRRRVRSRSTSTPATTRRRRRSPPTSNCPSDGFGYLTTRDGTTLSVNVVPAWSGRGRSVPDRRRVLGYDPSNPDPDVPFDQLFTALGYAYVGVNMRGSGCSGGSFAFFEDAQLLDGYDVIEAVAAQPWVQDHRVGMVGLSYPGISQLFVAATNPPSLAAITPMSVIDDSALGVMYPGGILNTGFGVEWTQDRMAETAPEGQAWAAARIDAGDTTCDANQRLRLQNVDLTRQILDNTFWTDELAGPLAPRLFVDRIDGPGVPRRRLAGRADRRPLRDHARPVHRQPARLRQPRERPAQRVDQPWHPAPLHRVPRSLRRPPHAVDGRRADHRPDPVHRSCTARRRSRPPPDRFAGQRYEEALATFESRAADPGAVRGGRRRWRGAGFGDPPLDPVVRFLAGAVDGDHLVPRRRRCPDGDRADRRRRRRRHRDGLPRRPCRRPGDVPRRCGHGLALRRDVGLAPAAGGHRGVVRHRTARRRHRGRRIGLGRPLDPHRCGRRRHRPRGHAQRDPARRPGGLRAERLAAGQPTGARRGREHGGCARSRPTARPTPPRWSPASGTWSASSCSRSPTRSGPGHGCG